MKDISQLPITIQIALALKTPELFNRKKYDELMKVKNLIVEKMYKPVNWKTGPARAQYNLELKKNNNKKKSNKRQASGSKRLKKATI